MNNKGFVLAWLSILLVIILGVLSSTSSLLIIQWNKHQCVEFCRRELKSVQIFAAEQGRRLLSLNPEAIGLRTELLLVESQILAALAAGQLPLVKILKIKKAKIRAQQKKLDMTQKFIIQNAHLRIKSKIQSLKQNLNSQLVNNKAKLGSWGTYYHHLGPSPLSKFSFKPNDQLLAPAYSPYKNFESSQSLAFSWIEKYKWNKLLSGFSFPTQIRSQCRISLREDTWKPIVQKDRL